MASMLSPTGNPKVLTSSYTFGSIIDIYNFDSTTGNELGIDSPMNGGGSHSQGNRAIYRAQRKISTMLQTYFYNLAPSPWSPPTTYLSLHRELEELEDLLHQLGNYDIDVDLGVLGFVTHGLFDLLQEVELLLMSSRVDGPRNEAWWERFSKQLKNETSTLGGETAFIKARDNVRYFVWAARWVLRVTVHGEYTRRITVAGNKVEQMVIKLMDQQLDLYVWDSGDGDEAFNIKQRFSEQAQYQGKCFVEAVKMEAAIRVWMTWAHKATVALHHNPATDSIPTKAYLNLLKAGWIFKMIQSDRRIDDTSDEARAVVALVCSDLVYTLKRLLEKWLPYPNLADLVSDGDWKILLEEGFEDWELEMDQEIAQELKRVNSHHNFAAATVKPEAEKSPFMMKDILNCEFNDIDGNGFQYSPIIMRSDDESDEEGYMISATIKTPLAQPSVYEQPVYAGSHSSMGSSYSADSYETYSSIYDSSSDADSKSPEIRSLMSPTAAPGSSYEMYEQNPYDTSDDDISITSSTPSPQLAQIGASNSNNYGNSGRREESPDRSYASDNSGRSQSNERTPGASRFPEHLSIQVPPLPTTVPLNSRLPMAGGEMKRAADRELPLAPPFSPLPMPPPITDTNGRASPGFYQANSAQGRFPRPPAVEGTMSSAGGRPLSTSVKGPAGVNAVPQPTPISTAPPAQTSANLQLSGGNLMMAGSGMAAKESSRVIPAPLHLSSNKKGHGHGHSIAKALKTARADRHEKGGWGALLTPMSGNLRYDGSPLHTPGLSSGGLPTSRRIDSPAGHGKGLMPPVQPLTVASGAVVAVNREAPRQAINKESISSPTPAGMTPTPIPAAEPPRIARKPTIKPKKPRAVKNTAARRTAETYKAEYDAQPGEVEVMAEEFGLMGALASNTGLPTGKWDECVIRLFRSKDGRFRIVTFGDDQVTEEWIDPEKSELVPEYAHHVQEVVPIIFVRAISLPLADAEHEEKAKEKARRKSARSSFGCVGPSKNDGQTRQGNAESFFYRFRRLDDMFNFQMAWTGEIVQTDIQSVKSIRYKKGFVGGESVTSNARVQIWMDQPSVHEEGKFGGLKRNNRGSVARIVLYWDEVICTMFITENLDIEAKPKSQTLKLKAARSSFNHPVRAKVFGQPCPEGPAPGKISATTSGGIGLVRDAPGGFSDESEFDDFKWFEIEFYEQDEMKWFYQDFMQAQKERMRGMRTLGSAITAGSDSGQSHHRKKSSVDRRL